MGLTIDCCEIAEASVVGGLGLHSHAVLLDALTIRIVEALTRLQIDTLHDWDRGGIEAALDADRMSAPRSDHARILHGSRNPLLSSLRSLAFPLASPRGRLSLTNLTNPLHFTQTQPVPASPIQ